MQNQIIITEINKPSFKALEEFNKQVFYAIQKYHNNQAQEEIEVKPHE